MYTNSISCDDCNCNVGSQHGAVAQMVLSWVDNMMSTKKMQRFNGFLLKSSHLHLFEGSNNKI